MQPQWKGHLESDLTGKIESTPSGKILYTLLDKLPCPSGPSGKMTWPHWKSTGEIIPTPLEKWCNPSGKANVTFYLEFHFYYLLWKNRPLYPSAFLVLDRGGTDIKCNSPFLLSPTSFQLFELKICKMFAWSKALPSRFKCSPFIFRWEQLILPLSKNPSLQETWL